MKDSKSKVGLPGTENQTLDIKSLNQVDFELLTTENRVNQKEIQVPALPDTYLEILDKIRKARPESEDKTINGLISIKCLGFKNQQ